MAAFALVGAVALFTGDPEAHAQAVASITRLHTFDGTTDPGFPTAGLFRGGDGNFYGTAHGDGMTNAGTLFRLTPTGGVTILYRFDFWITGSIT